MVLGPKTLALTAEDRAKWKANFAHVVMSCPVGILREIGDDLEKLVQAHGLDGPEMAKAITTLAFEYHSKHSPDTWPIAKVLKL